ncbi:dienelactone hydrolase family protein [Puniceibacterium sp. IMCC21224]|uniref:dienelactone hydrolase family protein n=1 Tax=Puniceibacterium sp. IMCC21224 TaxID=1618204 RepID=UPI00064DEC40|nr:dienelactone hydrolase family protein [Puniceibacterium sp. IMCC21224]KMK68485.1 dienelactone hydrolase-like enzyme [Puniceibacterium sp. IMCC21224]
MGQHIQLSAKDGFAPGAYEATAQGARAGVIVLQEIFGVNPHIRSVADRFAAAGYVAVAPALFDRVQPGFESGYSPEDVDAARPFLKDFNWDNALADVDAARAHLAAQGLKVGVVGFCLGGSLAFQSAARLDGISAAVSYYGGQIAPVADKMPRCPTMLHFGREDHSISMENVETIRERRPELGIHLYDAGHGFNCDARASYDEGSANLAWARTMTLFSDALGV